MAKTTFGIPFNPTFGTISFPDGGTITGRGGALTFTTGATNQNLALNVSGTGTILIPDGRKINWVGNSAFSIESQNASQFNLRCVGAISGTPFSVTYGAATNSLNIVSGAVLFGTATNSSNGRIQLASHTTSAGGISWGTGANEVMFRTGTDTATIGFTALTFSGGLVNKTNVQSITYTILPTDYLVVANSGSSIQFNLPATPVTGQTYLIKNKNAGVATISGNGANLYSTSSTPTYALSNGDSVTVCYDGAVWDII